MVKNKTIDPATKKRYNDTHKKNTRANGETRLYITVKHTTLSHYDDQIFQRSKEYVHLHNQRSRERQAKTDMFEDFVYNGNHEYWALREENAQLQRENAALAPAFLKDKSLEQVALPLSIQQLDDDPTMLKQRLTISDRERKKALQQLKDFDEQTKRARLLQEVAEKRVELLEERLTENGLSTEVEVLIKY